MMVTTLTHPNGLTKQVKKGFSWTVFFFGCIVPFVRGDMKEGLVMFFIPFTPLYYMFKYNEIHVENLIQKGYVIKTF